MRIQHNISALNTHRNLAFNNAQTSKNLEKLSSGYKINRAGDDAAGLAISEKMRGQIRGLDMASKNAQDGISLIQTAEGALNETQSILQRMRELAVQAGNDTNTEDDRGQIQKEIDQLTSEINRIGNTTEFNQKKLVNGDLSSTSTKGASGSAATTVSKTYSADFAPAADWSATSVKDTNGLIKGNEIKFSAPTTGDFSWADMDATAGNTVTVTRDEANNTFSVAIQGENASGATLTVAADQMIFDKDANEYSYNANGVSFKIDGSKIADWADGETFTMDVAKLDSTGADTGFNATADKASTASDFTTNTVAAAGEVPAAFKAGIAVDSSNKDFIPGVTGVKITATDVADAGDAKYVVELLDKDGTALATETLDKQDVTVSGGAATLSYNQNGIKFDIDLNDSTGFEIERKFDVTTVANTKDNSLKFQIGANENQAMTISIGDMRASALGISGTGASFQTEKTVTDGTNAEAVESSLDLSTHESAAAAITTLDAAINKVSTQRAALGAVQNRLDHTINNLGTSSENLTAAESRIRDTDMAASMMEFTKNNILTQAAQSMLAQANQQPQGVLQLLG